MYFQVFKNVLLEKNRIFRFFFIFQGYENRVFGVFLPVSRPILTKNSGKFDENTSICTNVFQKMFDFKKNQIFRFFFRSGGALGRSGGYRGLLRSEKMMKKTCFMMEKKSGIRKEIKSRYFGDQKYDV